MGAVQCVVRPRRDRCRSWACKSCATVMGGRLSERLRVVVERGAARGLRPILVSLTLNRETWPRGPLSAWHRLRELRAVPRAVKAFCRAQGIPFKGRYLIKMELQRAGWPHWHVLVMVPQSLQLPTLGAFDAFWKWGFSNVRHEACAYTYLAKYACKEAGPDGTDTLEASGLPGRHVHWLSPSRGFWAEFGLGDFDEAVECCEHVDEISQDDGVGDETHAERVDRCRSCTVLQVELAGRAVWSCTMRWRRQSVALELEREARSTRTYESGVLESAVLTVGDVYEFLMRAGYVEHADDWWAFVERGSGPRSGHSIARYSRPLADVSAAS